MFSREAVIWKGLHHPFLLPFLGIDLETFPGFTCLVAPWMRNGTLRAYLSSHSNVNADQRVCLDAWFHETILKMCLQLLEVAQAIEYLHSQNIVHGDVRGVRNQPIIGRLLLITVHQQTNILIDDEERACLGDFGLTGLAEATLTQSTTQRGSTRWMAPELHSPKSFGLPKFQRTFATDVYAFACVILEVSNMCNSRIFVGIIQVTVVPLGLCRKTTVRR